MTHDGTPPRPTNAAQPPLGGVSVPGSVLDEHLIHFRTRVLYDALLEATAAYWRHRATQFAAVGTPACDDIAQACRNKAAVLEMTGLDQEACAVILDVLTNREDAA